MSLRTIQAPGVEITEVDKSQYSRTLTGSSALVFGFATKGQDYVTNEIKSRSSWLDIYGEPETEAERYFYKASMEVIDNGGKLYTAKMPYTNELSDFYPVIRYRMENKSVPLSSDQRVSGITKIDATVKKFIEIKDYCPDEILINDEIFENLDRIFSEYLRDEYEVKSRAADDSGLVIRQIWDKLLESIEAIKDYDTRARDLTKGIYSKIAALFNETFFKSLENIAQVNNGIQSFLNNINTIVNEIRSTKNKKQKKDADATDHDTDPIITAANDSSDIVFVRLKEHFDNFVLNTDDDIHSTIDNFNSFIEYLLDLGQFVAVEKYSPTVLDKFIRASYDIDDDVQLFDAFESGEEEPAQNEILIFDITRAKYKKALYKKSTEEYYKECVGIVPIITTAANALYAQQLLNIEENGSNYNLVKEIRSLKFDQLESVKADYPNNTDNMFTVTASDLAINLGVKDSSKTNNANAFRDSLTMRAASQFPALYFNENGILDRENLKKIGVVVLKAYVDPMAGNKINFTILESFVGELDKNAKDPVTSATTFIDYIVNSQSNYIRFFSNCVYDANRKIYNDTDIFYINDQIAGVAGVYDAMTKKDISYSSIIKSLNKIFDLNKDINEKQIDIVVDAGVSSIGQFVGSIAGTENGKCAYDPTGPLGKTVNKLTNNAHTTYWREILNKYDTFCKKTRKDCMYIADIPRAFALQGTKPVIRSSKPSNTIDNTLIPSLRYTAGTNSSYGAGYATWFWTNDEFSGVGYWCPPSIYAAGIYINTDINYNYWDAPAGLTRGIVNAPQASFSPTIQEAGSFYQKNWNYSITYPDEGVILEGQKTFQVKPSAFDRVNVRRLFLRLERYVYQISRHYVYELNTAYTRQRFKDQVDAYFNIVKNLGGMYDYRIICDESINTPEVIDNNELRIRIGIKPTKVIEFILIEFVCLRTGGSWEELSNG